MGNPQKIKFRTVDEFLDSLPPGELKLVAFLRGLVFEAIPDCKEKLAYSVPFYYRRSRIVFIWPAFIPWGAVGKGVALGFCRGAELCNLDPTGKKAIGRKVFQSVKEINQTEIKHLLYEAVLLDEKHFKSKRKK